MQNWNSDKYLKFRKERSQPSKDLISRLDENYKTILDLGCGPGNSTSNLKKRFPEADVLGIDADDNMLEKARIEHPELEFKKAVLPEGLDSLGNYDLIFSNACIHWIPQQEKLIENVSDHLTAGGTFAVQLPLTGESPFYADILKTVLEDEKYSSLRSIRNFWQLDQTGYYNELSKFFASIEIWKTDYHHLVDSAEDVVSWYEGSGLRPYLEKLIESEKEEFKSKLVEQIKSKYRKLCDGKYFLVMPRLFFIAKKK